MTRFVLTTSLSISLAIGACSSEPAPPKPSFVASLSDDQEDNQQNEMQSKPKDKEVPSQDTKPAPSSSPSQIPETKEGEAPDTPEDREVEPVSVSVSISPINLSTTGESYWGRGTRLNDGSLVVSYGQDIDNQHTLKSEISRDEGKTWEALGQIATDPFRDGVGETVGDPTITVLPSGTLLAVYRNGLPDGSFRLQASSSNDGGKTWTFRGDIDKAPSAAGQMRFPTVLLNKRGQPQVYYSKPKNENGGDLQIVMKTSTDEGKTWNNQVIVAQRAVGNSAFPAPIRLKDGSILVAHDGHRGDTDAHIVLRYTQSNNDGLTWTAAKDLYVPPNGEKNANAPQITLLDDGRPVVVFLTNEDEVPGEGCCAVKMMVGANVAAFEDVSWLPQPIPAIAKGGLFPSVFAAKDGGFFLIFERGRTDIENVRKVQLHRVQVKGGL